MESEKTMAIARQYRLIMANEYGQLVKRERTADLVKAIGRAVQVVREKFCVYCCIRGTNDVFVLDVISSTYAEQTQRTAQVLVKESTGL